MDRHPGRDTRSARSRRRRTWYGLGKFTTVEKSPIGCFLHDVPHLFGDVSVPALPVLSYVAITAGTGAFGPRSTTLVAWTTTVLVATAIRGGWIHPPATDIPGWITLRPSLIGLRVAYFNLAFAAAIYGSVSVATALGVPPLSLGIALAVAVASTVALPRVADSVVRRTGG